MTKIERIIYSSVPVVFVINMAKAWRPIGFKGLSVYDVVAYYLIRTKKMGLNERAASISFNLVMAMPAAILFLFSIVPYLPNSTNFKIQILSLFKDLSPNSSTYKLIEGLLNDLFKKHVGVFSSGFLLLVFYSSNATVAIIRAFDKSIAEKKPYFFSQRWRAIRLTAILVLLTIGSVLMLIGQQELSGILHKVFHLKRSKLTWWRSVRWVIIVGLFFYSISFIYRYAPSVKKRWSLLSPGALIASAMMLITTTFFSFWVTNFANYNKVYGSIGTVLILMALIYFNALILLIGFELNVSIIQRRKIEDNRIATTNEQYPLNPKQNQ